MNNEQLKLEHGAPASEDPDWEVETVIEQVWQELQGEVNRAVILQVLLKIMPKYENARVTTYVPLLVHREAVDVLRARLDDETPPVNPVGVNGTYSTGAKSNDRAYEHNRDRHNKLQEEAYGNA